MADIAVNLGRLQWRLVVAALDAARIEIGEDVRLRQSVAGKEVLHACIAEIDIIRAAIEAKIGGKDG